MLIGPVNGGCEELGSAWQLPAKVLKRVGQIGRLGARGLAHTAYVRALGPTVYSLTDPARGVAARLHQRRARNAALPARLSSLKSRLRDVGTDTSIGKRQAFGASTGQFVLALEALLDLEASCCAVPAVLGIDWAANAIAVQTMEAAPVTSEAAGRVADALEAVHRAGWALGPVAPSTVALTAAGEVVFLDLGHAIPLANLSRDMSVYVRDRDRARFNRQFGTALLTAAALRSKLSPNARIPRDRLSEAFDEVYAPVVIRDDIRWGKIWNTDLGQGRWDFILKQHLPISEGGSVLDLGSNNGFNPLQMLRAGAASAVGVEIDASAVKQSAFLKSAYEWLDNRCYDFRCIHGSQGDLATFGLPRFDVVTAFCSLYYLRDTEVRGLLRHIRTMTDLVVLQCNVDRLIDRGGNEEIFRKASVGYALEVLEAAGFASRQVIAPAGYSRPLVIARAA